MKTFGWACFAFVLLCSAAESAAQPRTPIGPFVVDVRGAFARFKEDPVIANILAVQPDNLPTRGLGLDLGAHWYPLRGRRVTLGLGGQLLLARDTRTAQATQTTTARPTVTASLSIVSPQISLNFGHGNGWSYVSGGMGLGRLSAERDDLPSADGAGRTRTTHYGGGARWFTGPRLAFTFDLRFYTVNARAAATAVPAFPRTKTMVISAGISLR